MTVSSLPHGARRRDDAGAALRTLLVTGLPILVGCGTAGTATARDGGGPDRPDVVLTPEERAALSALSPESLPAPPEDPTNRVADEAAAAELGQALFFDASFSGPLLDSDHDGSPSALGQVGDTGRVACSSCHVPGSGFSDTRSFQRQISLGAGWGRRRAPSLLDVGHARLLMWDGRRDALYNQVFGPIESVVEMNTSRLYVAAQIFRRYKAPYEAVFGRLPPMDDATRFPPLEAGKTGCIPRNRTAPPTTCDGEFHGIPGDGAEFDGMTATDQEAVTTVVVNFGKAIAAYERLLSCGPGPFDAWMHGNAAAMSPAAQRGAQLFVGKGECSSCHSGPFLSDEKFHNVGLRPEIVQQNFIDRDDRGAAVGLAAALADPLNVAGHFSDGNDGRLPSTVDASMEGAFRTPMLRCVGQRPAFMHTGQVPTLARVVAFFDHAGDATGYPGKNELHALRLTLSEKDDLVEFLMALEGPGPSAELKTPR